MNVGAILREAWRISTRSWPLWLITVGMGVTFFPSVILGGALGGLTVTLTQPVQGVDPRWVAQVRALPTSWIVAGFAAGFVILILTSAITYLLQAAVIRGVAVATERGATTLGEALNLGRRRVVNIALLSLTLGGVILAISLLPWLAILLARGLPGGLSMTLVQLSQGLTAPVITPLSLALYFVIMAIAVEDVRPRAAPGRAWTVFRQGWWAFAVVFGLNFAASLPLVVLAVATLFPGMAALLADVGLGVAVFLICCGAAGLVGVPYLIFTTVFTTALFTLVFRAAAQLADAAAATLSAPLA